MLTHSCLEFPLSIPSGYDCFTYDNSLGIEMGFVISLIMSCRMSFTLLDQMYSYVRLNLNDFTK